MPAGPPGTGLHDIAVQGIIVPGVALHRGLRRAS
jgi:hypothetical protein